MLSKHNGMKLIINSRRKFRMITNMEIKQLQEKSYGNFYGKITREIIRYFEMNENEDIAYQNLWMQLTSGLVGNL